MMDLNRQIAKIDGKKHGILDYCICGGNNTYGVDDLSNNPHYSGLWCRDCDSPYMDYLAPENLHELVRIVAEMEVAISMEKWQGKTWTVMMAVDGREGLIAKHSTNLSHALAEAIIVAKG